MFSVNLCLRLASVGQTRSVCGKETETADIQSAVVAHILTVTSFISRELYSLATENLTCTSSLVSWSREKGS